LTGSSALLVEYICLAFVEDALERSNEIEIFGGDTAKESADLYEYANRYTSKRNHCF